MNAYKKTCLVTIQALSVIVALGVIQGGFFSVGANVPEGQNGFLHSFSLSLLAVATVFYSFKMLPEHLGHWIDHASGALEKWVAVVSPRMARNSVIILAGLTLFLELVLIRWQTGLFPVFALYKNFILLACFCGIGLGYALSKKQPLLLPAALPVMAITILLFMMLRYGADTALLLMLQSPDMESGILRLVLPDLNLAATIGFYLPTLLLLSFSFVLNVLILLPVSQLCGTLMERVERPLTSYGCNLLGSIGGVAALFVLSLFWSGPVIWFGICAVLLLWYQMTAGAAWQGGVISAALVIVALAWPVEPMVQNTYSPYQLIQKTAQEESGLTWLVASGSYHQHALDLSEGSERRDGHGVGFFELAYDTAPSLDDVLVIGSGIGNDVAAALRKNAGHVDAVEIDPAIIKIGRTDHPEKPYQDDRVSAIADDGRGYVRSTERTYDLITYGLQDTTIVMSHGTNVRFDTYLFTREGLTDSFNRLKKGGVMSVAFMFPADSAIGHKIYRILDDIPGAGKPLVVSLKLDDSISISYENFMVGKGFDHKLPPSYLATHDLIDVTDKYKDGVASDKESVTLPTDDWPFFLMHEKTFPFNYIMSSLLILVLSAFVVKQMLPGQGIKAGLMPFFFLGAGFMLVETKAIAELALVFGNTWQVIAITIIGVLIMAYLANLFVAKAQKDYLVPASIGLFAVIIIGYVIFLTGDLPYKGVSAKVMAVALLVSPLFFSGIIFSSLLRKAGNVSGVMAYNIMGAMLGGLLEYSAMRFGFSFLYLLAIGVYGCALLTAFSPQFRRQAQGRA